MSDVLAGMSRKEAEAWLEAVSLPLSSDDWNKFAALAALGARCVGAKERTIHGDSFVVALGGPVSLLSATKLEPMSLSDVVYRVLVLEGE